MLASPSNSAVLGESTGRPIGGMLRVLRNLSRVARSVARVALADDPDLQALSRVLFGQAHRLTVMLGVARSNGVFSPGDLAFELGFRAQSSIQDPLRDLALAGLVSRLPKVGNRSYYRRCESRAWDWVEELATQCQANHERGAS